MTKQFLFVLQGFERVYDNMPDLSIDVPCAYNVLERFVVRCRSIGIIDDELVRKMPTRYDDIRPIS